MKTTWRHFAKVKFFKHERIDLRRWEIINATEDETTRVKLTLYRVGLIHLVYEA